MPSWFYWHELIFSVPIFDQNGELLHFLQVIEAAFGAFPLNNHQLGSILLSNYLYF